MHLQQLKLIQSSKQGVWEEHHFSIEGMLNGVLWAENGISKGEGVGPRGGALPYKNLLSTPPPPLLPG